MHNGEIIIKSSQSGKCNETFRYAVRSAPTSMSYAEHVRRGLGFREEEAPIVALGGSSLWFHFAGSAYESILTSILPNLKRVRGLFGLAVKGSISEDRLKALAENRTSLTANLHGVADELVPSLSLGRFHKDLPVQVRKSVAVEFFGPDKFIEWLKSRKIGLLSGKEEPCKRLRQALTY